MEKKSNDKGKLIDRTAWFTRLQWTSKNINNMQQSHGKADDSLYELDERRTNLVLSENTPKRARPSKHRISNWTCYCMVPL